MDFQETFTQHLKAIRERDLEALQATLPDGDRQIVAITVEGQLVRTNEEYLEMHREWFESDSWSISGEAILVQESGDLAVASLKLDYFDQPADQPRTHDVTYATLVFERQEKGWVLILEQNTPAQ